MSGTAQSTRLAVIPARGGSQRMPDKNIRPLLGRPLISYTVLAAIESGLFDRVVVSTDDRRIAAVARDHGAEVPFVRGAELADSSTPSSLVTLDALRRLDPDGRTVECVAQLLPTSPLRTAQDVRDSFESFRDGDSPSQISLTRYALWNPWWARRIHSDRTLSELHPEASVARSQDLADIACPTGAIWWARAPALRQAGTFYTPGHTGWMLSWDHAVDIDTEEDWQIAELLMGSRCEPT